MTWLLDLDGVVWLAERPIAGSPEAVAHLRQRGERVVFVTNNSSETVGAYVAKLERCGIPATADDVVTSAQAAARLVEPGETALVCGGPGVTEALEARGVRAVRDGSADAVVVGWHRDFGFERMHAAFLAVRDGARLIGTNDDATYPTPCGPLPGGGAMVAAVSYAAGVAATFAGKPFPAMVELLHERVGDASIVVGDRPSTDGLLARRLGVPFALVLSGVTAEDAVLEPQPDRVARDLAALVGQP
jgi:glycerol 3-phosphatase-2